MEQTKLWRFLGRTVLVVCRDGSELHGVMNAVEPTRVQVQFLLRRFRRRCRGLRAPRPTAVWVGVEAIRSVYPYMADRSVEVYHAARS